MYLSPEKKFVYRCFNGELEIYEFLEESLSEGATIPTWVLKAIKTSDSYFHSKDKFRTNKEYYHETIEGAYKAYLSEAQTALPRIKQQVVDAMEHYAFVSSEVARIKMEIEKHEEGSYSG